ncbi:MAG: hypothetical protein R3C58_05265 [Parvularculaceae bacterium]
MASIAVYTHPLDRLYQWRAGWPPYSYNYLLSHALRALFFRGHKIRIVKEPKPVSADLAILHVDATVVDPAYMALAGAFGRAINFRAGDISKRKVSRSLVAPGDPWPGKVIVKSDLNYGGLVEARRNRAAAARGMAAPYSGAGEKAVYDIYDSIAAVPDAVWRDGALVVEKFMPEIDPDGYAMRTWVFMGGEGRCFRHVATVPVIKSHGIIRSEPVDPPEEMFAERERLGIDFGKFDFVVYDGRPVLLDANKTPGAPAMARDMRRRIAGRMADGVEGFLAGRAA